MLLNKAEETAVYTIYQLVDPRNNTPRYIGLTAGAADRYKEHLAGYRSTNVVHTWIEELKSLGLHPIMQVLELVEGTTQEPARQREAAWIHHHVSNGLQLLNVKGVPLLNAKGVIAKFTGAAPFRHPTPEQPTPFYPTPEQLRKLDDLAYTYNGRTGKRINSNDIGRRLVDTCDIGSLQGL